MLVGRAGGLSVSMRFAAQCLPSALLECLCCNSAPRLPAEHMLQGSITEDAQRYYVREQPQNRQTLPIQAKMDCFDSLM